MSSDFDSFDQSSLGFFIESQLGVRGGGSSVGDIFVIHQGTSFNRVGGGGIVAGMHFYDSNNDVFKNAGSGDNGFNQNSFNTDANSTGMILVGTRLFVQVSETGAGKFGLWSWNPATEAWVFCSSWPFSNSFLALNVDAAIVTEFNGSLIIAKVNSDNADLEVYADGDITGVDTPEISSDIISFNPGTGIWTDISSGLSDNAFEIVTMLGVGSRLVISTLVGHRVLEFLSAGYTNAIASDIGKAVIDTYSWTERIADGHIDSYDSATTYTITIGGDSVSVINEGTVGATRDALVVAANDSTDDEFVNLSFTGPFSSKITITNTALDFFLNGTFSASLTVSGGTGTVTDFSNSDTGKTEIDNGTLKYFDNTSKKWWVTPDNSGDTFPYDGSVTITSGTGAGSKSSFVHGVTAAEFSLNFIHYYDGAWNIAGIKANVDSNDQVSDTRGLMKFGTKIVLGSNSTDGMIDGTITSGMFIWNIPAETYTKLADITFPNTASTGSGDSDEWANEGGPLYFLGRSATLGLDGIIKLSGTTLTQHSPDLGTDEITGMATFEFHGNILMLGTNNSSVGITKPPNNFYQLSGSTWVEYLGSGTSAASKPVWRILHAGKNGALIYD